MSLRVRSAQADKWVAPAGGVEVPWDDWRKGTRSDVLYTRGLEECIGVGIDDLAMGLGHMAHVYSTEASQDRILPEMCESVRESCGGNTDQLTICLAGGMGHAESTCEQVAAMDRRMHLIEKLRAEGIDGNWIVEWNDNDRYLPHNLELYCATGAFILTEITKVPWRPMAN